MIMSLFLKDIAAKYSGKYLKRNLFISILSIIPSLLFLSYFLQYAESRSGARISDPLLQLFSPVDLTYPIFIILYFSLILSIVFLVMNPEKLSLAIRAYSAMVLLRMFAMFLLPLEPPEDMILLEDPFVEFFVSGDTLTKDLFFSGHTATMTILSLTAPNKYLKRLFIIGTFAVAVMVILQKVHYSIDVLAAVPFSYLAYKLAEFSHQNKFIGNLKNIS